MVDALTFLIAGMIYYSLGSLILGLFRPVFVLWFLDRFNRLKVIKIYGFMALVFSTAYTFLKIFAD